MASQQNDQVDYSDINSCPDLKYNKASIRSTLPMKCISCDTDNNLKDRTANMGRCKSCNHRFVFEPTAMPTAIKLTDPFFAKLIMDLSANNTLFFTPRQLYYSLDKKLRSRESKMGANLISIFIGFPVVIFLIFWISGFFRISYSTVAPILFITYAALLIWGAAQNSISRQLNRRARQNNIQALKVLAGVLLLIGLPFSIITNTVAGIIAAIVLGCGAAWLSFDRQRQQSKIFDEFLIDREQFDTWLNQWRSINNQPENMLAEPKTITLPAVPNLDVAAYSFDRVVVCNSIQVAQILINNNFHFENNCAILTIDGYPENIFVTTMEMLRRNPDLKVYALHDCSPTGIQMVSQLRHQDNWFPDTTIPIMDVGILPRQIMNNIDATTRQSSRAANGARNLPVEVRSNLNTEELQWLEAGCYLDLESFSSQKIIQILQKAINSSKELDIVENNGIIIIDNYESSSDFYTIDSFG